MKITRYQAGAHASRRWTDRKLNRSGRAWRRRNAAAPYEVGYTGPMGPWGGQVARLAEIEALCERACEVLEDPNAKRPAIIVGSSGVIYSVCAIPELIAEIRRLRADLDHATCAEGDHLSKASRLMVETVMVDRDALRAQVRQLQTENADLLESFRDRGEFDRLKRSDVAQGKRIAELLAENERLREKIESGQGQ